MRAVKRKNEEISALCAALGSLTHAGIGVGEALSLMAQDEPQPELRTLLTDMARRADEGMPLARNLRESGCMPEYVCGLLEAGGRVGKTEQTLDALADYYAGRSRMEQRVRAALLYPSVLLAVMLAVVVVLLVWVLPVFNGVYAQLGSGLTGVAGGLLLLGDSLRRGLPVLCVLLVVLAVLAVLLCHSAALRERFAARWNARWGHRGTAGKIGTARIAQALSLGLSSGLTHQEAAELTLLLTPETSPLRKRCEDCMAALEEGETLAAALRGSALLSAAHCRLLEAGIRSGRGEAVMEQIAGQLLEASEESLETLVGRIEPALVLVTAVLVGVILLTVMLPLLHIMSGIG